MEKLLLTTALSGEKRHRAPVWQAQGMGAGSQHNMIDMPKLPRAFHIAATASYWL
jgi:hypothetical protein